MSQNDVSNVFSETQSLLEQSMKELLEKILTYMEKFIKTKDDLVLIESKLNDYDNLVALMEIIKSIFNHLTEKVDSCLQSKEGFSSTTNDSEYEQLEKIVQKHEAEIRTHIRLEQQLKLYAESLQSKLEESEKTRAELLESTKNIINGVKRDNQKLSDTNKQLKEENERLLEKLKLTQQLPTQERSSSYSMHALQKENSYKKLTHIEMDQKKKIKSETPPVGNVQESPGKQPERRTPTPNILSSGKNSTKDFKNSYTKFYNQVKKAKEESVKGVEGNNNISNRDLRSTYNVNNSQVQRSHSKDRETRNISSTIGATTTISSQQQHQQQSSSMNNVNNHGNSINLHSLSQSQQSQQHPPQQSLLQYQQKSHKRSQSHQINKMRGLMGNSKQQTDYSRLSNQDFSDLALAGSMIQQEIIKKSQH